MAPDEPDLAALTGSRICHDLASPIGAALTGLEFVSGTPGGGAPEDMALLRDSLTGARATLAMLRTAFARAGGATARDAGALGDIVRDHLAARPRLRLDWALRGTLAPATQQHIALAILCAAQALPRGGTLALTHAGQDGIHLAATPAATGALAADPALWDGLTGLAALPAADPRQVEFHLLAARIARGDARIEVSRDDQTLSITLLGRGRD